MSGLIHTQCRADGSMIEATVMSVDILRFCCEVKTNHGQKLGNVQWLLPSGGSSRTGNHISPTVGDRVVISFSLSYPLIIGFLPPIEPFSTNPIQIDSGLALGDTGNLSSMQDPDGRMNPGKPEDMVAGDQLWSSEGGGLMGLLRSGTIILRASRLAQIVISKLDDIVRIVGRNFEIFTDVFIDVAYNLKGRIYRFTGYSETHAKVRADNYSYKEYHGDTALGEYAEDEGFIPAKYNGTYPNANTTIKKVKVIQNGNTVYTKVLDLDGHNRRTVDKNGVSYIDQTGEQIQLQVVDGATTTITMDGTKILMTYDDGTNYHYMQIDQTGVHTG